MIEAATSISWKAGISGDWSDASDWSGGVVPGASDNVTISAAGSYTVSINSSAAAASLLIENTATTVDDSATLTLAGALSVMAGTLALGHGGEIRGGTISAGTQGDVICSGGTLAGVIYQGTLNLGTTSSYLNLKDQNIFRGAGGVGAGDIDVTGAAALLVINLDQTISNVDISLGSNVSMSTITVFGHQTTLTLGSDVAINQVGKYAEILLDNGTSKYEPPGTVVNEGTITAGLRGGTLDIQNIGFNADNSGGDTLVNQGALVAAHGGTLLLETNLSFGSLDDFSTTSGGVLDLGRGTLANAGGTLLLGKGRQLTLGSGVINGGTIQVSAGALVSDSGTLNNVTFLGAIDLTGGQSLVLSGSVNSVGPAGTLSVFNVSGDSNTYIDSSLVADGGATLNDAMINLGEDGTFFCLETSLQTVTLGSNVSIAGSGASAAIDVGGYYDGNLSSNVTLINQGTIVTATSGDVLTIDGGGASTDNPGTLVNQGILMAANGGTLVLDAILAIGSLAGFSTGTGGVVDLEGTLENAGNTLKLGAGRQLTLNGLIVGGTIADSGNGLIVGEQADLRDVTYVGTLNLDTTNASLLVESGLTDINGIINVSGENAGIGFVDTGTLDNMTVDLGSADGAGFVASLGLDQSDVSTMTLGSAFAIDQAGTSAKIFLDAPDGDSNSCTLVNQGTIAADVSKGLLSIVSSTADQEGAYINFVNAGSLSATKGDSISVGPGINFNNTGQVVIDDGTLAVGGLANNGTISVASGLASLGSLSGAGICQIGPTGILTITGTDGSQQIDFISNAGLLDLGTPSQFLGVIAGFGGSAEIDLLHTNATGLSFANGVLSIEDGAKTVASLNFTGSYNTSDFVLGSDGHNGTAITFK